MRERSGFRAGPLRRIFSTRCRSGAGSVESVFAQAQQVAAEAEVLVVDADWRSPELVAVEVIDNRDDTPEPQRSLVSWSDFMAAERAEPKRRSLHDAPTLSLFEWALEREREGELAGAAS